MVRRPAPECRTAFLTASMTAGYCLFVSWSSNGAQRSRHPHYCLDVAIFGQFGDGVLQFLPKAALFAGCDSPEFVDASA